MQETFTLAFADGSEEELTIAADLLPADEFPGYSYLVMTWLLEHIGLTVFLTVLFLLLTLLCFGFSMASAGHWAAHEGVHLTWLDKIPADVWLVALICAVFAGWDVFYGLAFAVFCAALAPVLLLFLCAFAAQCKAGTVLRGTLIARVLRLLWRIIRAVGRGLRRTAVGLPLIWKTALVTLAVFFAEMLYGYVDGVFAVMKLVEFLAILYIALNLRILQKGGEKLAAGDYSQSIDTRPLIGDFKRYGQRMNELRTGMERAVREQTRAERMKTELITNVSHDIKTPLTSIVNYVDLLEKEDICVMNAAGEQIGGRGRRSSEYLLHEAVYQARPDVTAVVHSHCPFLTAYALRYQNFDVPETCSLREVFTHFTCLPYGKPGTHEIHRGIGEALADSPICLLGGHGVVCASTSLERCIGLLEAAEGLAKTIWLAK